MPGVPAAQIDAAIDSERLVEGLQSVIRRSAVDTHAQPSEVDGQVVKSACALLVTFIRPSTLYKGRGRHLLDKLTSAAEFTDLLRVSLLDSADTVIRVEVADLILTLYLYVVSRSDMRGTYARLTHHTHHTSHTAQCGRRGEQEVLLGHPVRLPAQHRPRLPAVLRILHCALRAYQAVPLHVRSPLLPR